MTEFKRCTAEIDDLDAAAAKFADHVQWSDDVERAKREVDTSVAASTSLQVRVGKLLAKAREKDPDRQIYNENMCQRIEELAARGAQVFARFDETVGVFICPFVERFAPFRLLGSTGQLNLKLSSFSRVLPSAGPRV